MTLRPHGPLLQGILPLRPSSAMSDVVGGITLAALGIPEVMGYTRIAQTPLVTGLYTMVLPAVAFALLGSSRHLVVAADSATAAILAASLMAAAAPGTDDYLVLTSVVALVVGLMLVLASLFRLGFLADFLSRSALIGLLSGIGLQVAAGELAGLLGLARQGQGALLQVWSVLVHLGEASRPTTLLAAAVLALILGCQRWAPKLPGALIAVIGSIAACSLFDLPHHGIAVVGAIPKGLPALALPSFALAIAHADVILATAASCFVVILAQSAATSRAFAQRYQERCDENVDLIGLAAANLAAGITGTFVVNGSPTKTEMVDEAGGRSQLAQLTAAVMVAMVLLFLAGALRLLPAVVLSVIVFIIGVKLIDGRGLAELYRLERSEFGIALATAATVALVGVKQGIVLAVVLSLLDFVRESYRPRTRLWTRGSEGDWRTVPVASGVCAAPGVVAYRFESNLFYANANGFMEELLRLTSHNTEPIHGLVVDASGIDTIDYSAAKTLLQMHELLSQRGVHIVMVAASVELRDDLARYGIGLTLMKRMVGSIDEAIEMLR